MNSKFFDVNKEKQDNIINAALRIFSVKGYKDASTDTIVKEAGISKGLLFHYFESKKGLYEFICDYSAKYMTLELTRAVKGDEKDFFNVMSQIEMGKTRVLRNYPYMQQFLRGLRFERDPEAIAQFGRSISDLENTYNNIYAQINPNKFINPEDCKKVIEIINWMNDGLVKERLCSSDEEVKADVINDEFTEYLMLLKRHFYKSEIDENISVAKEEEIERNEAIMDEMKMGMTFEERLLAGKRPLVDLPVEESETKEDEPGDVEEVKKVEEKEPVANVIVEEPVKEESADTALEDLDDDDLFFDTEDEGDVMTGVPKVTKGEILNFPNSGALGASSFSSGNIDEIIEEANSNLHKQES